MKMFIDTDFNYIDCTTFISQMYYLTGINGMFSIQVFKNIKRLIKTINYNSNDNISSNVDDIYIDTINQITEYIIELEFSLPALSLATSNMDIATEINSLLSNENFIISTVIWSYIHENERVFDFEILPRCDDFGEKIGFYQHQNGILLHRELFRDALKSTFAGKWCESNLGLFYNECVNSIHETLYYNKRNTFVTPIKVIANALLVCLDPSK
eukprot:232915_1